MFNFNPVITLRNLYRHKSTTLISILGFTFGLVATIFLYFYIHDELSYDSFHKEGDQIYRVARVSEINGTPYNIGVTSGPFARALENDFPSDVNSSTRALPETGLVAFVFGRSVHMRTEVVAKESLDLIPEPSCRFDTERRTIAHVVALPKLPSMVPFA